MNGYQAFYNGRSIEVFAHTSSAAQRTAAQQFKARNAWEVTVMLCEMNGHPVVHTAVD